MENSNNTHISDAVVLIRYLSIRTKWEETEEFIDELEELCRSYCVEEDFNFKFSVSDD